MARVGEGARSAGVAGEAAGEGARGAEAAGALAGRGAQRVSFPGPESETGARLVVEVTADGSVDVDHAPAEVMHETLGRDRVRLVTSEGTHTALVLPLPDAARAAAGLQRVEVVVDGWRFELEVEPEARARLRERATSAAGSAKGAGPLELRAIIPGRVVSVDVALGDAVEPSGRLLVIEAMKMQNELRSPRSATVARLAVGAGQTVERGDLLLVLE